MFFKPVVINVIVFCHVTPYKLAQRCRECTASIFGFKWSDNILAFVQYYSQLMFWCSPPPSPGFCEKVFSRQSCTGLDRYLGLQDVETLRISKQWAHEGGKDVSLTHRPPLPQAESTPRPIVWPEGLNKWKIQMTPSGFFCVLFYCVCTSSVLVSLSWLSCILPFVFTYDAQHKHPCPRRYSNVQPQQALERTPSP